MNRDPNETDQPEAEPAPESVYPELRDEETGAVRAEDEDGRGGGERENVDADNVDEWEDEEDEAASDIAPGERPMGFFDHLEELRWTIVKCVVAFGVFAAGIGVFLRQANQVLLWPLHRVQAENAAVELDLGTRSVMESFTIVIQMCGLGGLVMALPFMFFFVGQFIRPALNDREVRLVLPVCLSALGLFVVGAGFSFFFLVPSTIRVSVELNELFGFVMRWTPEAYYSLLLWLVLGVGAAFEFPLLIVVLVWMGVLSTRRLIGWWRHSLLVIFIISAIVTPTPDPVTQTALAVPLYGLYWLAVLVASRVEKRRAAKVAAEEAGESLE
ncbi:twin-arginine translocase subunit TatC [Geminisphaera colitermitum]|uniref:twin-arginine translocase subunit TatC n=1 Tax=Geminisphaera colitermitum TaxID=1148786 RepID=UPI0005BCA9E6|nr:twin-arginine translocase subunit TatC [Geminisphaera colitermitum]